MKLYKELTPAYKTGIRKDKNLPEKVFFFLEEAAKLVDYYKSEMVFNHGEMLQSKATKNHFKEEYHRALYEAYADHSHEVEMLIYYVKYGKEEMPSTKREKKEVK